MKHEINTKRIDVMNNVTIDCERVFQKQIASSMGLVKYVEIINTCKKVNVSEDDDFQRLFNGFYRVRRNEAWRYEYYSLFEELKREERIEFERILVELYERTGNIEPSFASKMLATINDNKPIWDKHVVEHLGVKLPGQNVPKEDRLKQTVLIYDEIVDWYKQYLETYNAQENIRIFNRYLPDYKEISDVKKIDAFLWSLR